jgi:hypothetical protein
MNSFNVIAVGNLARDVVGVVYWRDPGASSYSPLQLDLPNARGRRAELLQRVNFGGCLPQPSGPICRQATV